MIGRRLTVVATAVAAAALAGAGVAYSSSHSPGDEAFLNDFAKHLGVSPADVRSAWLAAVKDQLDQAVRDGRLTQAQADAMLAHLEQHQAFGGPAPFGGPPGQMWHDGDHGPPPWAGPKPGKGPFGHPDGDGMIAAAASYLGLSIEQLGAQLRSGTTLAQIAAKRGRSVAGLEAAMLKSQRAQLQQVVDDGRITKSQAAEVESHLERFVHDLVHHGFPPFGRDDDKADGRPWA